MALLPKRTHPQILPLATDLRFPVHGFAIRPHGGGGQVAGWGRSTRRPPGGGFMEKETLGAVGATGVGIEVFADSGTGRLAGGLLGGGVGCNVTLRVGLE